MIYKKLDDLMQNENVGPVERYDIALRMGSGYSLFAAHIQKVTAVQVKQNGIDVYFIGNEARGYTDSADEAAREILRLQLHLLNRVLSNTLADHSKYEAVVCIVKNGNESVPLGQNLELVENYAQHPHYPIPLSLTLETTALSESLREANKKLLAQ